MVSLADFPELVGFFSYSRDDDEDSKGALSALRERIQRELRGQLGRSMKAFRLWQDKEAIAPGKLWQAEIKAAIGQSAFFIPIITPTVVGSPFCRFELEAFLAREAALGRTDLVFPVLYIRVPSLEDSGQAQLDPVLSIIAKRQYVDWREFRHRDVNSTELKEMVERFCANICNALRLQYSLPEERQGHEEAAPSDRADDGMRDPVAEATPAKRQTKNDGGLLVGQDDNSIQSIPMRLAASFKAARRAVPAVDFALGFASVAALSALVIGLLGYARAALIIFGGILIATLFVMICARLFSGRNSALTLAGIATVWAVALFFITFLAFTATAVAFKWPPGWSSILGFDAEPVRKVSVCPIPNEEMEAASCGHADGTYVVVNIRWDDADRGLVVRDAGSMRGIQLGVIPPNGTDITVPPCDTEWCPVQCKGLKGWSRKRYLSERSLALRTVTGIAQGDPHGLSVRTGPHPTCRSVGSLSAQGRDVILHGCESSPVDRSTWCRVTYNNLSGWVPDGYLERQK